jgi:F-type H+-transporting ATPase subunit b
VILASVAATTTTGTPNFIVPNGTIVVEIVLFLLVLGLVSVFVLRPVQRVLEERDRRIRTAFEAGESAQHEAAALDRERHEVLERARGEARQLIEEATRTAEELRANARAEGQAEHDRLLAEANATIEASQREVRSEMFGRLESMVGDAASRVVGVRVDVSRHRDLIAAAIARSNATTERDGEG